MSTYTIIYNIPCDCLVLLLLKKIYENNYFLFDKKTVFNKKKLVIKDLYKSEINYIHATCTSACDKIQLIQYIKKTPLNTKDHLNILDNIKKK